MLCYYKDELLYYNLYYYVSLPPHVIGACVINTCVTEFHVHVQFTCVCIHVHVLIMYMYGFTYCTCMILCVYMCACIR